MVRFSVDVRVSNDLNLWHRSTDDSIVDKATHSPSSMRDETPSLCTLSCLNDMGAGPRGRAKAESRLRYLMSSHGC